MASIDSKATADTKKTRPKPTPPVAAEKPTATTGKPRRRKRFRLAFWLPLFAIMGLLASAPSLISWTPLGRWVVQRLVPVDGSIEFGSLSVGWFSPIAAGDVTLRDSQGAIVAKIAAAGGDKSLVGLILDRNNLGHFEIDQPQVFAVLREQGSNLEDVLAPLLGQPSGGSPLAVSLKVTAGSVTIDDQPSQRKFQINDIATDLQWDGSSAKPLSVQAGAKLVDAHRTADLQLALESQGSEAGQGNAGPGNLGAGHLTCKIDRLPLDVVEPFVRRSVAGAQLAGWLTANLECTWGSGLQHDEVSVQGEIDAADLLFAAAALGRDRIEMAKLTAPCNLVGTSEELRIEKLLVDCDLGNVSLTGKLRLSDFKTGSLLTGLARESGQLNGQVDLVRIAALLPETLQIRPGTQITAGQLTLALASQPQDQSMSWSGRVETSDLEAIAEGQEFKWEQPLAIEFQAHDTPGGPVIDKINCDSSFLRVEASGTLDQLTAGASFDLSRLATELARFVEMGSVELAGIGQAQLTWQRGADNRVQGQADVTAHDFALVTPGHRPWREATVAVHLDGTGVMAGNTPQHVDTANARFEAAAERLTIGIVEAIDDPLTKPWPLAIDWQGELAAWLPRVELWADVAGWELSGRGQLRAQARASLGDVEIQEAALSIDKLHAWGHGFYVDEPRTDLSASGRWQRAAGKLDVPLASLKTTAMIARLNNFAAAQADKAGPTAAGSATLQGDLATLAGWLQDPRVPAARRFAGQVDMQVELTYGDGTSHATLNSTIDQLQVAEVRSAAAAAPAVLLQPAASTPPAAIWREARLTLAARLDYDTARDELQITQGALAAEAIRAEASGKVAQLHGVPEVDLTGQVECDWEQLAPLWRPYLGSSVQIVGREPWPFTLRGSWTNGASSMLAGAQHLTGEATVRWLSASAFGLQINRGALDSRLTDGTLTLQPVDVEVSGGRITLAPTLRLAAQPPELELPRGPLISNVQLTPQICEHALKFAMPLLAEVTRTSGQFSADLQGGRLPLADLSAGDVVGQMQIQAVEVKPGPILQSLLGLAKQVEGILEGKVPFLNPSSEVALVRIENQTVDFRLVNRRVYHRGLQFAAGNVTITTRGWVGLDESLSLVAEVPLSADLLANHPQKASLNNQVLQIPITGTLKQPKFDPAAMAKFSGLLLKNTTKGVLIDGVGGALEKLIPANR
jgi:translocation and assembly module TamB